MALEIVLENAEQALHGKLLDQDIKSKSGQIFQETLFLQCKFFQVGIVPDKTLIETFVNDNCADVSIKAYLFKNGDVFFEYLEEDESVQDEILKEVGLRLGQKILKYMPLEDFFDVFDLSARMSELKLLCFKEMGGTTKNASELAEYLKNYAFLQKMKIIMKLIAMQRSFRRKPHILIVEDQVFSQKVLKTALGKHVTYCADNVGEAVQMYIEKCPDIVLLDVKLPDLEGHSFARFLNKIDEDAFIVMITANNYKEDVDEAIKNKVKKFITKPFKEEKIKEILEMFNKEKKKP